MSTLPQDTKMKVFIDTNILLDIIEGREKFLIPALNIFDLGMNGNIEMYATSLTFANCMYVARKNVGQAKAIEGLRFLKKYVKIASMDDMQCVRALNSDMADFEDMLQYEAALAEGCGMIVTRDANRHFPTNAIPILSPQAFLDSFAS